MNTTTIEAPKLALQPPQAASSIGELISTGVTRLFPNKHKCSLPGIQPNFYRLKQFSYD